MNVELLAGGKFCVGNQEVELKIALVPVGHPEVCIILVHLQTRHERRAEGFNDCVDLFRCHGFLITEGDDTRRVLVQPVGSIGYSLKRIGIARKYFRWHRAFLAFMVGVGK